ncbi:MAG TPA: penicillin-binding protein 2 [Caulobacteraceae bacterium]|nr:penicillin-binding protein 2 [Caulobacteraceae bacterium]
MTALGAAPDLGREPPPRRLWWLERAFERAHAAGRPEDDARLRIFFVLVLFAAAFVALALGATKAALFSGLDRPGETAEAAPGARGDIVDRNGRLMATDVIRYALYVEPKDVADKAATAAALIQVIPGLDRARLDKVLDGDGPAYFIAGDLTPEVKEKIFDLALPGLSFQEQQARAYPLGEMTAHLIGFASKDGRGLSGVERAYDGLLRGRSGAPLVLSIDLRVQGALHDELAAAASHFGVADAAALVVDVKTGEILGMSSWPTYDPNRPGQAPPAALVDHAAATVYEPGSVFKVFTLAMGLDSGVVNVNTTFDVHTPLVLPGQTIHDYDKGDTVLPLWEVFTHSSNIGAARMALLAGADRMDRYFHAFGLFAAAPSELAESARPLTIRKWTPNAVASMAFGHSISVSPLAIATGMSAILNGGVWRPLTLRALPAGAAPAPGRRVIQESTSRTMLDLMRLNVVAGTGKFAEVPGYWVGGKTGTATKLVNGHYSAGKLNLASFAAIFPTDGGFDRRRYLVLVMMDEPHAMPETGGFTTGGAVSAPIVGRIIARIAPLLGVQRQPEPPPDPNAPVDAKALVGARD